MRNDPTLDVGRVVGAPKWRWRFKGEGCGDGPIKLDLRAAAGQPPPTAALARKSA